jgi:hypothetical protein
MSNALTGPYNASMLLEFIAGIKTGAAEKFKTTTGPKALGTRDSIVDLLEKDIRSQIEVNLPVIYWVKPMEIIDLQVAGLIQLTKNNDPKLGTKYIESITVGGKTFIPGQAGFNEALINKLMSIRNSSNFSQRLLVALKSAVRGKTITLEDLGNQAQNFSDRLQQSQNNISVICSIGTPSDINNLKTALTNEVQRIGYDFKKWLLSVTPAEIENAENYIVGFNPKAEMIFIGGSFKSARGTTVNKTCQEFFLEELPKMGITPKETFGIGDFTAAGHAGAAFRTDDGIKQIQGINTPLTQEILFLAEQKGQGLGRAAMQPFLDISDHVDLSIEFTKQVRPEVINSLLHLNFSFLVTQEDAWNSSLGQTEKAVGNKIVETVLKRKKKELTDGFKELLSKALKDTAVSYFRSSPTIRELVGELLANSIRTGKTKSRAPTKGKKDKKGKPAVFANKKLTKAAKSPGKIRLPQTGRTSINTSPMANMGNTTSVPINLLNLMNLINTHLQDVISSNMGDGSSKNVLNYRTGRFAASAQVERMSYSKEGTITAFYDYMKNPYATFSAGGKQSKPTSRDPKLLISKSIREIAQQVVSNKLRAVSV